MDILLLPVRWTKAKKDLSWGRERQISETAKDT
jgi:hypothetical protein